MKRRVPKLIVEDTKQADPLVTHTLMPEGLVPPEMLGPVPQSIPVSKPTDKQAGYFRGPCGCSLILPADQQEVNLGCAHQAHIRLYRVGKTVRVDADGPGYFTSGEVDAQGRFKS